MSPSSSSSSPVPLFDLASCVAEDTPPPPVLMGAKWRSEYPIDRSPFIKRDRAAVPAYVDVAQGVPSHLPSDTLLERFANESAKQEHHSYRAASEALVDALAKRMNAVYRKRTAQQGRSALTREDISITAGCNMASETAFRMLAQPGGGDAIVLPTPYYFNHAMQLSALNIATIPLPCDAPTFQPDPVAFCALLNHHRTSPTSPRIKALVLVTPNNPTGSIYPPALLAEFARICRDAKIALILDETYRDFLVPRELVDQITPDCDPASILAQHHVDVQPHTLFEDSLDLDDDASWDWRTTIIQLFSFSKSFAIPGHRLGALVCHPVLKSITPFQGVNGKEQYGPLTTLLDNSIIVAPRYDTQCAIAWALADPEETKRRRIVAIDLVRRFKILHAAMETSVPQSEYSQWNLTPPTTAAAAAAASAKDLGWQIVCHGGAATSDDASTDTAAPYGGYYVFIRHPFDGDEISSTHVCQALATLVGLGTLAQDFFEPQGAAGKQHLRLSLANVKDVKALQQAPVRMALLSAIWRANGGNSFGL